MVSEKGLYRCSSRISCIGKDLGNVEKFMDDSGFTFITLDKRALELSWPLHDGLVKVKCLDTLFCANFIVFS